MKFDKALKVAADVEAGKDVPFMDLQPAFDALHRNSIEVAKNAVVASKAREILWQTDCVNLPD